MENENLPALILLMLKQSLLEWLLIRVTNSSERYESFKIAGKFQISSQVIDFGK